MTFSIYILTQYATDLNKLIPFLIIIIVQVFWGSVRRKCGLRVLHRAHHCLFSLKYTFLSGTENVLLPVAILWHWNISPLSMFLYLYDLYRSKIFCLRSHRPDWVRDIWSESCEYFWQHPHFLSSKSWPNGQLNHDLYRIWDREVM